MSPPRTFWCHECSEWTHAEQAHFEEHGEVVCEDCFEPYKCDWCGFEIDRSGNCLRREAGAEGDTPCPSSI